MLFDLSQLEAGDRYKLMASSITPRPIAWVTTLSPDGARNAAPYSFFNMMAADPPLIALGLMRKPNGERKDTCANILATGEFVVNLVSEDDLDAMNWTCAEAPAGYDELAAAGVATAPSAMIQPPRIASAPVSFECRVVETLDFAPAATVVIGQVLALHMDDRFVDPERLHVDTPAMQLMARMHGAGWYTRSTDRIQRNRPRFEGLRLHAAGCSTDA